MLSSTSDFIPPPRSTTTPPPTVAMMNSSNTKGVAKEVSSTFFDITNTIRWIQSYQYHLLYCCIYITIGSYCLSCSKVINEDYDEDSEEDYAYSFFTAQVVYQGIMGLMVLLLLDELRTMSIRRTLPPGDLGYPIVGNLPSLISRGPRDLYLERTIKYGSLTIHKMLGDITMLVTDDDDVNFWLTQERKGKVTSSAMPHIFKLLGKEAVMLEEATQHRRLRRIFQPSFSPQACKSYVDIADTVAKEQLDGWSTTGGGEYQESREWSLLAMRLFLKCAFNEVDEVFMNRLNELFQIWLMGFITVCPYPIPGNRMHKALQAKQELSELLLRKVNDFRSSNPPGSELASTTLMGRLCYGVDDDGNTLSDSQLITNLIFIMFAGHDTTKGSFCAFAHYINKYPHIAKLLEEEVESFAEPLDLDELKNAPILNSFLAETWRLASPLGAHIIQANEDIPFKGYTIKKGVKVALCIQGYNVRQENGRYVDPLEFKLERWLPKGHPLHNSKYYQDGINYNVMSSKYRAFAMGVHGCLGAHFAKMEARVVLTRLLQSYKIEVQNESLRKFPLLQHENEFRVVKKKMNTTNGDNEGKESKIRPRTIP